MLLRMSWPVVAVLGPLRVPSRHGAPHNQGTGVLQMQQDESAIYMSEMGLTGTTTTVNTSSSPMQHTMCESGAEESRISESASTQRGSAVGVHLRLSFGDDDEF